MENDFSTTTEGISVNVEVFYLEDQSSPQTSQFVWAYRVRISNGTEKPAQLLRRSWVITDARGHVTDVEGEGVVGKQPTLGPGESFEYTSGTPLRTASGFMTGLYHMVWLETGEPFDIVIPVFSLDSPYHDNQIH